MAIFISKRVFFLATFLTILASPFRLNAQQNSEETYLGGLTEGIIIRAMVISPNTSTLSAQIAGRVISIAKREGEPFQKADVLVAFDCTSMEARVAAAKADVSASSIRLESAIRMFELKSIGQSDVDLARAEVEKVEAELAIFAHDAKNCLVTAPYNGKVIKRQVGVHEYVKLGSELLQILDTQDLELEILVPSTWLRWVQPNVVFNVTLDATGASYPAKILRIGAEVDPSSQSAQVFGRFMEIPRDVLSGMSGNVTFPQSGETQ